MVLETNSNGKKLLIDYNGIYGVISNGIKVGLYLYGRSDIVEVDTPFSELEKDFIEAKSRCGFIDDKRAKRDHTKFDIIKVKNHKFQLNIVKTEYDGNISYELHVYASFIIKNDVFKTMIESVSGVERCNEYATNKYSGSISIGSMFDAETVRADVEQKIREFLQD